MFRIEPHVWLESVVPLLRTVVSQTVFARFRFENS